MKSINDKRLFFVLFPFLFIFSLVIFFTIIATDLIEKEIIKIFFFIFNLLFLVFIFFIFIFYFYSIFKKNKSTPSFDLKLIQKIINLNENLILTINEDSKIAWTSNNKKFKELLKLNKDNKIFKSSIKNLIGEVLTEKLQKQNLYEEKFEIKTETQTRYFLLSSFDKKILIFRSRDLLENWKQHSLKNRLVFFILALDNKSTINLNSARFEEKKTEILAYLTIQINEVFSKLEIIVLSTAKSEFFLISVQKTLEKFIENRFQKIKKLEKAIFKKYNLNVTFSSGIYSDKNDIIKSEKDIIFHDFSIYKAFIETVKARQIAQSRGGDQTIVLEADGTFESFGQQRSVQTIQSNESVEYKLFKKILKDYKDVLIVGHRNPDWDVFGAAIALKELISLIDNTIKCSFVSKSINKETKREIQILIDEKKYDENVLSSFNFKTWFKNTEKKLVILVDSSNPSFFDFPFDLVKNTAIGIFDHHNSEMSSDNIVFNYSTPKTSSASELVLGLIMECKRKNKELKIPEHIFKILLGGILGDTNNLQTNLGEETLSKVDFIQKNGINLQKTINEVKKIYLQRKESTKINLEEGEGFKKLLIGTNIFIFSKKVSKSSQFLAATIAEYFITIHPEKLVISIISSDLDKEKSDVFVSVRNQVTDLSAALISEQLGGGGDKKRSAAQLKNTSIQKVILSIKKIIKENNLQ